MSRLGSKSRETNPRETAGYLSSAFFFYTLKTFRKGFKRDLTERDVFKETTACSSHQLGDKMEKVWAGQGRKNLTGALLKVFGTQYLIMGFSQLTIKTCLLVLRPILIGKMVSYFTLENELPKRQGYLYGSLIITTSFLDILYMHNYMFLISQLGIRVRVSICSLLYRKILNLSADSLKNITNGNIVTLMDKDAATFDSALIFFHDIWVGVIQIGIMTYIMYSYVEWASFVGVTVLVVFIPLQILIGANIKKQKLKSSKSTDRRTTKIKEVVASIKSIKMLVWEKYFLNWVHSERTSEMRKLRLIYYLKTIIFTFGNVSTKLSVYVCILVYVSVGERLSPEKAFAIVGCYNALKALVTIRIPMGIIKLAEASAALKRIESVLNAEEIKKTTSEAEDNPEITISNARVKADSKNILQNINLHLTGGLVGITGAVDSGKSTLIGVILREVTISEGDVKVKGKISYASQEPWLFPATIRSNIVFGETWDRERYENVIDICALRPDLDGLVLRDETVVLDKGQNLSKGQQARINLARAIYRKADVYILDNVLCSLDPKVSKSIFFDCIRKFLSGKLRILVTDEKSYLEEVDRVFLMEDGGVSEVLDKNELKGLKLGENVAEDDSNSRGDSAEVSDGAEENLNEESKLLKNAQGNIYSEEKKEGKVDALVYLKYFISAGGVFTLPAIIGIFLVSQLSSSWFDYFIADWQEDSTQLNSTSHSETARSESALVFTLLIISLTVSSTAQSFVLFYFTSRASIEIHRASFLRIIEAPMDFFEDKKCGNILNRFSKDIGQIDENLPFAIYEVLRCTFMFGGILVVISIVQTTCLWMSLALLAALCVLKHIYQRTGRSLKRIEAATRSPVTGHLNASLEGITTIRASSAEDLLKEQFDSNQDLHSSASYMCMTASRAFGFYLDFLCSTFFSTILLYMFTKTEESAAKVGLVITQIYGLTGLIQWCVLKWAELENNMVFVERLLEYSDTKPESKEGRKPNNWPTEGKIKFEDVELYYQSSKRRVLKNLTFDIEPRSKVGFIGRTGAGKSTITYAFFRLYPIKGSLLIDGEDVRELNLKVLRENISIIPQDPLIFPGSIRCNMDPYNNFKDGEIWNVLEEVKMKGAIKSLDCRNFVGLSKGQKQLLCLARTILNKKKIVIFDEATADVDQETNELILKITKEKFSDCTLLIVAHREDSIRDCNKIFEIAGGNIIHVKDQKIKDLFKNKQFE